MIRVEAIMTRSDSMRFTVRFLGVVAVLAALLALYLVAVRPWMLQWGATASERTMRLPGDELVPRAAGQGTRAITIDAPAARVWPWVAQIGQDRSGFYSYEILEDAAGARMPRRYDLDPAFQVWRPGDKLWMSDPATYGGAGYAELLVHMPGRALVFGTRQIGTSPKAPADATWGFFVLPRDAASSRLLFRGRGPGGGPFLVRAFTVSAFDPIHFVMERRTLEAVKDLAEGRAVSKAWENAQVALWTVAFLAFVASGALTLAGRRPRRRLVTFAAGGLVFAFLTLIQPSLWIAGPLVAALLAATFAPLPPPG